MQVNRPPNSSQEETQGACWEKTKQIQETERVVNTSQCCGISGGLPSGLQPSACRLDQTDFIDYLPVYQICGDTL